MMIMAAINNRFYWDFIPCMESTYTCPVSFYEQHAATIVRKC